MARCVLFYWQKRYLNWFICSLVTRLLVRALHKATVVLISLNVLNPLMVKTFLSLSS